MTIPHAALPFLPAGQGPLILIYGGLVVLGVAVPWSVLSSRSRIAHHLVPDRHAHTAREARVVESVGVAPGALWAANLPELAAGAGLGPSWLMSAHEDRAQLLLTHCPTCSLRRRRGCEPERRRLERLMRQRHRRVRVREVACNGRGACTFEVRRGR